jgi:hypothetical protein
MREAHKKKFAGPVSSNTPACSRGIAADTRRYFLFFVRLHTPKEHPDTQCAKLAFIQVIRLLRKA